MAFGSFGKLFSNIFGSNSGPTPSPLFPQIDIAEDFWPQVQATVTGIDQIAGSFQSFRVPLQTSVAKVISSSIRKNFDAEGRPSWASLSDSRIRGRQGNAHPILNDTGKLKNVATSLNIWHITNDSAQPSGMDSVPYAGYHQGGTRKMPQREFITIHDEDIAKIEVVFDEWIALQIAKGWSK